MQAQICTDKHGRIWVVRRPSTGLLAGLWALPMQEVDDADTFTLSTPPDVQVKHAFTHLIWLLDVYRRTEPVQMPDGAWDDSAVAMTVDELSSVSLGWTQSESPYCC